MGKTESKDVRVTQQLRLEGNYRCCPAQALKAGILEQAAKDHGHFGSSVFSTMKNLQLLSAASFIVQLLEIFFQEPHLQLCNWVWVFSGINCRVLSIKSGFEATIAVPVETELGVENLQRNLFEDYPLFSMLL